MTSKILIVVLFLFSVSAFAQKKCLFIVANSTLSTEDQIINDKLVEWGYDVTPQAPADLKYLFPVDYAGYDFAFISESIGSGDLGATSATSGGTFSSFPLPTATLEGWLVKPGAMDWESYRTVNNFAEGDIKIVDGDSPLAAGFATGATVTLITDVTNGAIVASYPKIPIIPIATLASNTADTMFCVYGIEAGTHNVKDSVITHRVGVVGINATGYPFNDRRCL